jgi:hypothetical protein
VLSGSQSMPVRPANGGARRGGPREQQTGAHAPGHEPRLRTPGTGVDSACGSRDASSDRHRRGRGDVAPFTGLGAAMRAAGHSVTIATGDVLEGLVTGCGLGTAALSVYAERN